MAQTRQYSNNKTTSYKYYDAYRNFGNAGNYYSHTSSAYKVELRPEEYPEEIYAPNIKSRIAEPRIEPEPAARPKKKQLQIRSFKLRNDPRIKITTGKVVMMICIFSFMLGIVQTKALEQGAHRNIKKLGAEISEVKNHIAALQTELYENYDKEEIERLAAERLNMTKRKAYQEVHVSVPKSSYIVQNKPKPAAAPQIGLLEKIFDLINGE